MSKETVASLRALTALAYVDLGESALTLADRMDEQAQVGKRLEQGQAQMNKLSAAYERLSQPGEVVYPAALTALARQSAAARGVLLSTQNELRQAEEAVDVQRQMVQSHQSRYDGLSRIQKQARMDFMAEGEKKLASEREDLYLMRRYTSREHA